MKSISIDSGIVPPIVCILAGIKDWLVIGGITGIMKHLQPMQLQYHTQQ